MATDILQGILTGFSTGIGVGIANWLLIKRLERLEDRVRNVKNGVNNHIEKN